MITECPEHYGYEQPPGACNECHRELKAKYLKLAKAAARVVREIRADDLHASFCDQASRKCLCCGCQCGTDLLAELLPDEASDAP